MKSFRNKFLILSFLVLLLAACSSTAAEMPELLAETEDLYVGELIPFHTPTPLLTNLPEDSSTPTPFPTLSPAPRTYVIQKGDMLGGIAYYFGVTVQDILDANPGLNVYALSVGTEITIPVEPSSNAPTREPVLILLSEPNCAPTREGGMWCLVYAENGGQTAYENLNVSIRLITADGDNTITQTAEAMLNLLPANGTLPLVAYFESVPQQNGVAEAMLEDVLPAGDSVDRYLNTQTKDVMEAISIDGMSANIQGGIVLGEGSQDQSAQQVWIVASAFDEDGQLVGVRRLEYETNLTAEDVLPFEISVYSMNNPIDSVQLIVEARPE
jgi:LysM repeat protein